MESEIQFLLNIVLNYKIPPNLKKLCLERIGKIEESLRCMPPKIAYVPGPTPIQSPSTQALLDRQVALPAAAIPVNIPASARDKETGLVNMVTSTSPGGSTRGPSKVFR